MKHLKIYLIVASLIIITGCTEEEDEPTRTYWKKNISNLFEIRNNEFYAIYKKKLDIYDISNPNEIQNTEILNFKDELTTFSINKDFIFSADKDKNFYIIDNSDPTSPFKRNNLNLYSYGKFELQNHHLYATSYKDNITSINVLELEDINNPVYRQKVTVNDPISMTSNQKLLFVCESPAINTTTTDGTNTQMATDYSNKLTAYDLSEPSNISTIELDEDFECGNLTIIDNTLIDISEGKMRQYDISELSPVLLSTIDPNNMM